MTDSNKGMEELPHYLIFEAQPADQTTAYWLIRTTLPQTKYIFGMQGPRSYFESGGLTSDSKWGGGGGG